MSRKTLINEVLPAPSPRPGASLRDRVKRHAQKVLASGAIVGLANCAETGTSTTPGDAGTDAGTDAGYAVVDPLPPPCTMYDPGVGATGSATIDARDGEVTVRVMTLSDYPWTLSTPAITDVEGATLARPPVTGSSTSEFIADFTPDAGASAFSFHANLSCNDFRGNGIKSQVLLVQVTVPTSTEDAGTTTPEVVVSKLETDGGP